MQVISCSGHHSPRNCSVNLENVNALRNSFGIKVSNHQKHEKAFRGRIFSFTTCGNNHFKKLRAKTVRWLNFARSHVSVKEPDLPWPLQGQLDSPGLHSVLSPLGGGDNTSEMRSPLVQTASGLKPLAVQFCITRCQCGLSQLPHSFLCRRCTSLPRGAFLASWQTQAYLRNRNFTKDIIALHILKHNNPALFNTMTF